MVIAKILSFSQLSRLLTTVPLLIVALQCKSTAGLQPELPRRWQDHKYTHALKDLTPQEYQRIALLGTKHNFEAFLDPLLIPRVPGTDNWVKVKKYLMDHMNNLGWNVETDAFEDNTPLGKKPFENIIATLNPTAPRRLVIACHFDSKYESGYDFIGAVDSAVPCAQMLHLAYSMKAQLDEHKNSPNNVTLQYIFFDGEEAFQSWSQVDSLYGSRHLAAKWENTPYPPNNRDGTTELNRIDVMMLLDLIGASGSKFHSFFEETSHLHGALVEAEQSLKRSKFLTGPQKPPMFLARSAGGGIEDDHIPFLQRRVDILHVIALPFPSVWHTARDTKDALDFHTIENLNRIFRVFVARYLHIPS